MQQESQEDMEPATGRRTLRSWLRSRLGERGATAVETALIFPMLMFTTFGILEFGIYWQRTHTINESARAGARLGATLARELNYQDRVTQEVADSLGSLPETSIESMTIFKADPSTGDPFSGTVSDCTVDCYRYTWDSTTGAFVDDGAQSWDALSQAACGQPGRHDYLGIYVEANYESAFGLLPGTTKVSETTMLRLEPVPLSGTCEP